MKIQYKIDALRFGKHPDEQKWKTHPDIKMVNLALGKLRVLDTREGGDTILIIPDGPNIIEHYFEIVKELRTSCRVIIFDLYGFGFSTHDGVFDYTFEKSNEMILELLDLLKVSRVIIVFPCAGGFYGLSFTEAYPEKVKHLMLLQTPSLEEMNKWSDRIVPGYLKYPIIGQLLMPMVEKKFGDTWYDYALPKGADGSKYKSIASEGLNNGASFCLCSLTQGIHQEKGTTFSIDSSIPMTLIYGNLDFTHRGTDFNSINKYHKSPNIILFENCGHFPDLERQSDFIAIVKEKVL